MKRANSSSIGNAIPYTRFCGILKFALPPHLHARVLKPVFMSATQDEVLFERAFPEAHTENLPPTAWKPGAKVYKLRTNRKPRSTVYQFTDGTITGLSDTGENYWQLMIDEIARPRHQARHHHLQRRSEKVERQLTLAKNRRALKSLISKNAIYLE